MRPQGSAAKLEQRRMRAWELLERGWRVKDVAEALGVNRCKTS